MKVVAELSKKYYEHQINKVPFDGTDDEVWRD
jgi:hypothetical protein